MFTFILPGSSSSESLPFSSSDLSSSSGPPGVSPAPAPSSVCVCFVFGVLFYEGRREGRETNIVSF